MDTPRKTIPDSPAGYVLTPAAVVRLAGSPVAALDGLRCARSWRTAGDLVRLRAGIAETAGALSDLLHAEIGAVGDGELKATLVAVRRAVHRGRRVDPARWADLPADLLAPVRQWTAQLADRDRLMTALPKQLEQDVAASYESLRTAARQPAFQLGLVHANPDVFLALRTWLGAGHAPQRRSMLRLAQYLARSAAKTSPYSTFTGSGLAAWGRAEDMVELSGAPSGRRPAAASATEVSVGSLHRIARAVGERPQFAGGCRVRLNPSATVTDDALVFLGRRPVEHVHALALTPTLRRVMELTAHQGTLDELRGSLASTALDGRRAEVFLQRLMSLGLLELEPAFADQSADPIGDLRAWLHRHRRPGVDRLDQTLHEVHEALSGYPTITEAEDRIAVRATVIRGLDTALREVGDHAHAHNPKLADEFARYSFYENAVYPGTTAVLDRGKWRPLLDDLDAVRTLLGLTGPDLPFKLTLGSLFLSRYPAGAQVPLLAFYRDVLAEQSAGAASNTATRGLRSAHRRLADEDSPVDAVRELHRLRAEFGRLLSGRTPDQRGVVRIDPEEVRTLAKEWPGWVRTPTSVAVYCQLAHTTHGPELVVNNIGCGFGRGRNRVRHVLELLDLRAGLPDESGLAASRGDVLFAEFEAVARSAVNVRKPGVRLVLDYPGVRPLRGREDLLPVNDLFVRCGDDGLPVLVSQRLGKRICPVHPGLGADRLLPPAARFMVEAFGESDIWLGKHAELSTPSDTRADDGVRHRPRLMVGDVVLRRAVWTMRADRLPRRADATSDAAWMLKVAGWLAEHGIPERCFVTVLDPAAAARGANRQRPSSDSKPNYVDFASMLLLLALDRRLVEPHAIVQISEMLPAPGQIRGECVAEYIVELNEPGVSYV